MQIHYQDELLELPDGSLAFDLVKMLHLTGPDQALAIDLNGQIYDLNEPLSEGDRVKFWNFDTPKGKEIFWHTSAHVLAQAVLRLYPEALPTIGPPIENGFYYDFAQLKVTEEDLPKIEKEIKKFSRKASNQLKKLLKISEKHTPLLLITNIKKSSSTAFPMTARLPAMSRANFSTFAEGPIFRLWEKSKDSNCSSCQGLTGAATQSEKCLRASTGSLFRAAKL